MGKDLVVNVQTIESWLKDYHWMINRMILEKKEAEEVAIKSTAQYGIEASMPKAQGGNSDPVGREVQRRLNKSKSFKKYEKCVSYILDRIGCITDDKEYEILNLTLDGKSQRAIANIMGLSRTSIQRYQTLIAERMYSFTPTNKAI